MLTARNQAACRKDDSKTDRLLPDSLFPVLEN